MHAAAAAECEAAGTAAAEVQDLVQIQAWGLVVGGDPVVGLGVGVHLLTMGF